MKYVCYMCDTLGYSEKEVNRIMRTYLKGAAIAVELTADLSFGTVVLVTGQLKDKISQSISLILLL